MGRPRRTESERENYQQQRRIRETENQRRRRQVARQNIVDNNRVSEENIIEQDYLGQMNVLCTHCQAKHFDGEKVSNKGLSFNDCCGHGTIKLDPLPDFPLELLTLFNGEHDMSSIFFERIRNYNNSLSFASFNANLVNFQSRRPGPFCFKIQGQVYYQMNTALYPNEGENPSNGQLFIIDQHEALNYRIQQYPVIDYELMTILDGIIRNNNIYAKSYEMMKEEVRIQQLITNARGDSSPSELQLLFSLKPNQDLRRYNFQRVNEVAAIFSTTADGEIPESYVTIRNKNTKTLEIISSLDPNVEPWIYPLFYPYGSRGWHKNMMRINSTRRKISRLDYTRYKIALRDDEFNPIIRGRRLFQQWVVDSYVKIEKDRIQYCKDHQKELRADTYKGLHDHMRNCANDINGHVGKTVILPSSFNGSPRYMQQCYQDAMAIVNETGKPDIFLTMTCNPNWPEISENLLPGQQAADRPDLVARVFDLKKDRLLDIVVKNHFFGKVASYVYVVEFQKRGLPHMHLLITLEQGYKITTADIVDKFISAEIPIKLRNPRLYDIVMRNMIHGPCGDWCMKDGKCSKKFPKQFQQETTMDENGFPHYRRRDTGVDYECPNGHKVNNAWVVPYCAELSQIFDCHINVEIVSSITAVKYLYKYIYKGHDAATVVIGQAENGSTIEHDECRNFIETRYVGPVEACYRIFSLPLQNKSHSVVRLPVHLPHEQSVIIMENVDEASMLATLNNSSSMLLDYFTLNATNDTARQYYYPEIPKHFTYKKIKVDGQSVMSWETRKNHFNVIGRMYSVSPTQIELFHLRLLLLHIKGATSYDDLKTIDNVLHPTFTAACLALGIIEDDEEWNKAMREAVTWMMPQRLRHLFARILIHCQPIYPEKLWETFKNSMSEDFARNNEIEISYQMAYSEINNILIKEGKSLAHFPTMDQNVIINIAQNNDNNEREHQLTTGNQQYEQLNSEQKEIVDKILAASRTDDYSGSTCFYIDGQGGSGKTFVYTTIYNLLMSENIKCSTMAYTGIAATLLPNGKTVHKTFGLPVPMFNDSSSNIKVQSNEGIFLKNTKVFIWDEAPMAPRYALEIVDRTLKYIMNNDLPFGGKIMILGGDFRQLLPIKVNGTRNEILNLSLKNSHLWPLFSIFHLKINMRVLPHEIEFANYLLHVGNGTLNDQDNNLELPEHCILPADGCIVKNIFGKLIKDKKFDDISQCAILSARNADVDDMNNRITNLLDKNTEHIYTGIDSTENCDNGDMEDVLLPEYLNSLNPPNFPPHKLRLRKFCIVMLIRNISLSEGLCNGTRLQVIDFSNHLLQCKILTGDKRNNIIFLNRITLYCENQYPFTFKRRQFPVRLAFAITINKSQGQTLEKIGIDLRRDVFNHGQLYVAMSRVRSWDSVKIYLGNQRSTTFVKNFVYTELYQ